jgi:hypothetical protein
MECTHRAKPVFAADSTGFGAGAAYLSGSIAVYRLEADLFVGKSDGKLIYARTKHQ